TARTARRRQGLVLVGCSDARRDRASQMSVPVVDLSQADDVCVAAIDGACRSRGFFTVVGHGVPPSLVSDLAAAARWFFERTQEQKSEIAMATRGSAWRGWFPLGGELTSGRPDRKEGVYFGAELPSVDPRPMHGPNLFPAEPAELRPLVLRYLDELT